MKIEINYNDLVKNYNEQLTNKLRDFGESHLKYWIPDENIYLSIPKLIFSIHNSHYSEITLNISSDKMSEENYKKIYKIIKIFSECLYKKKDALHIFYIKKISLKKLDLTITRISREKIQKTRVKKIKKFKFLKEKEKNITQIKNLYLPKKHIFINILKNSSKFSLSSTYDDYGVYLNIERNIINEAYFSTGKDNSENIFLDIFCSTIIGLTIQEAYEHGIIKLEYFLRPKNIKNNINGIINPFMKKNIFSLSHNLISNIWQDLSKESKYKKNTFDLKLSKKWESLQNNDKEKLIINSINAFEKMNGTNNFVIFKNLNKDMFRISLTLNKNNSFYAQSPIFLLRLEEYLRKNTNEKIELFYEETKDANKLRMGKLK